MIEQNTVLGAALAIWKFTTCLPARVVILPVRTGVLTSPWHSPKPAQQVSVCWADCHFSVSLCTDPPPLRKNLKGSLLRFFSWGEGGSVTGYLVFVPWADCHFSSDKPRIPALAKMSSFSMTLLHLYKWQLAKCDVISSMHPGTNTFPSTPLLGPHSAFTISRKQQLDFAQLIWSTVISLIGLSRFCSATF